MCHLIRFGYAAAVGLALGGAAAAQTTGGTGGTAGGGTGGGGALAGSSAPTGSGISFNNSLSATPTIGPSAATGQTGATSVNQSNIFGQYYANPYFQGRAGSMANTAPGGFGQTLYGTGGASGSPGNQTVGTGVANRTSFGGSTGTGGATTGFGGQTANRSGAGGTNAGFGNAGGLGGSAGGFGSAASSAAALGGQVIQLPRQIAYTATVRFATPPMTPARVLADARTVLDRSTMLSNPRGVEVLTDGQTVVLRGAVKDEDEARLAENMLRLTPGVRDVRNELRYAPSPQP